MRITARRVDEGADELDKEVEQRLAGLVKGLYNTQLDTLGEFLRAMGVSVQQIPPSSRLFKTAEKSDTSMQSRYWFVAECKSENLDCKVQVAFLYNPQSTEIDAVRYRLDAGEGVPAMQVIPAGQASWLYSEVVVKRFGAVNADGLMDTMSKALDRVIRADMKAFRAHVEGSLASSRNAILQLIRVGGYKV